MPKFATALEEAEFWKRKYEEIEKEYEEYQQNSQMIEKELEMSLEQAEKMNRDLKTKNNHLVLENETLKVYESIPREVLVNLIILFSKRYQYSLASSLFVK